MDRIRRGAEMMKKWMAVLGIAAALAACAHPPTGASVHEPWNGGIWNSVLGYHGPYNVMNDGQPAQ